LYERGYFEMPASSKQAVRAMERDANPVGAFVEDKCAIGEERQIYADSLYNLYLAWCAEQGIGSPVILATLSRDLLAAFPEITHNRQRRGAKKVTVYHGIGEGSDEDLLSD